ncbi:hypothetical protein [Sedimenticola sp.]|uniref:hypothetical protein n=1 Tax=Sedimenticola sp. TaxID=1940285 RepID=UPI003D0C9779
MKDNSDLTTTVSDRALEMIMRDVLDGLYELSLAYSLSADSGDFEILEIRPASESQRNRIPSKSNSRDAEIIDFPNLKRACG